MAPPATVQAERAEATRARILDIADRLFRSLGYQKTAVADIAGEAGMSPANVYRFFASKSAINEAIAERVLDAMLADLHAVAAGEGSAAERFQRYLSVGFEQKIEQFFAERRLHDMVTAAIDEHWGVIEAHIGGFVAGLAQIIADGQREGDFAPGNPAGLAERCMHAMVAFNHPYLIERCLIQRGQTVELLRQQVADMTAFLLRALRHPDERCDNC